jgi:hypothetical protein
VRSAATLEGIAAVVVTVITVLTAAAKIRRVEKAVGCVVDALAVAGVPEVLAGAVERTERRCGPSAATLEGTGVAMTVITVITGDPTLKRNEEGRTKERSCPTEPTLKRRHSGEGKSQRAKSFGMKWNEPAFRKVCKLLKMWWPGMESNRRRQPFQGCYPRWILTSPRVGNYAAIR